MAKTTKSTVSKGMVFPSRMIMFTGIVLISLAFGAVLERHYESSQKKLLLVQDISKGSMVPISGKADTYDLSVKNKNDSLTYFSEAPEKSAGKISMDAYLSVWNSYFSLHHPNAALVIYDDNGNEHITMGELLAAKRHNDKNRIDYTFRLLSSEEINGLSFATPPEQKRIDKFGTASLFIDAWQTAQEYKLSGGSIINVLR